MIIPKGSVIFSDLSRKPNENIHCSYWNNIECAKAVYLIESDKTLEHYKFEEQLPVSPDGLSLENIFVIEDGSDVVGFAHGWKYSHEWVAGYMNESSNVDFCEAIKYIYADIRKIIKDAPEKEWSKDNGFQCAYPITLLTSWTIHSSTEWETGHSEVDAITYDGLVTLSDAKPEDYQPKPIPVFPK